ncbi:MAG TPA: DNA repair protein RecN [Chitinophagales bacterium]|nr:DNA repair protein RecN [Chitinophagales bacterium]HNL83789.1 DNA repair protein RecN [Chitinophagales bacterium]
MLRTLSIKNYAIIESVLLEFDKGLNIITGETGAGKSILLGALNLILGKRADVQALRNTDEKCTVEASFYIKSYRLKSFFKSYDLDYEDETIIRREINSAGKSRAFINDIPVTLDILKQLTEKLVDIHAQGETQNLLDKYFYCEILDELCKQTAVVQEYQVHYAGFQQKQNRLKKLTETNIQLQKEFDFISFQLQELKEANIDEEEAAQIESELNLLQHAETIKLQLNQALQFIDGNEQAALSLLLQANKHIAQLANINDVLLEMHDKLTGINEHLKSMSRQITQIESATEYNAERVQYLSERQSTINNLLRKHHVVSATELLNIQHELQERVNQFNGSTDEIAILENELKQDKTALSATAQRVSANRAGKVKSFESAVSNLLKGLGMEYGYVELKNKSLINDEINEYGIDSYQLWFSPNKGIAPQPLETVGSGGEKSRLMLAIKSLVADTITLPTLIFDEIDTGISGDVAQKVGMVLKSLGNKHQVISITHLPQVAAKANNHLFVYKKHDKEKTYTEIKVLNANERLHEIAVMLSGNNPPKEALENAKRLLN